MFVKEPTILTATATNFGYYFVPQRLLKQLFLSVCPAGNPEISKITIFFNGFRNSSFSVNKKLLNYKRFNNLLLD